MLFRVCSCAYVHIYERRDRTSKNCFESQVSKYLLYHLPPLLFAFITKILCCASVIVQKLFIWCKTCEIACCLLGSSFPCSSFSSCSHSRNSSTSQEMRIESKLLETVKFSGPPSYLMDFKPLGSQFYMVLCNLECQKHKPAYMVFLSNTETLA